VIERDCACYAQELKWDGRDRLAFVFVELTPACNNHCPGCSNVYPNRRALPPLSASAWEAVWQSLRPHVALLKLTGGEPTLHPEFPAIIRRLQEYDFSFVLFTNGRWQDVQAMVHILQSAPNLRGLLVSLHGATAEAHEKFSGVPGSFEETLVAIKRAIGAGLPVTLSTVITRFNADQLERLIELVQELGAEGVALNRYIGAPLPALEPTPEQFQQVIRTVQAWQNAGAPVKWGVPLPLCWTSTPTVPCLAGKAFVTVDPWGKVRPCNHAPLYLGDLLEQPLMEILQSPAAQSWQSLIPERCADCSIASICHGSCRAEMLLRPAASYFWSPAGRKEEVVSAS